LGSNSGSDVSDTGRNRTQATDRQTRTESSTESEGKIEKCLLEYIIITCIILYKGVDMMYVYRDLSSKQLRRALEMMDEGLSYSEAKKIIFEEADAKAKAKAKAESEALQNHTRRRKRQIMVNNIKLMTDEEYEKELMWIEQVRVEMKEYKSAMNAVKKQKIKVAKAQEELEAAKREVGIIAT
jgi:hypothetical protein